MKKTDLSNRPLESLVTEAKEAWKPDHKAIDWERVDDALFDRIAKGQAQAAASHREASQEASRAAFLATGWSQSLRRIAFPVAATVALAAGVLFYMRGQSVNPAVVTPVLTSAAPSPVVAAMFLHHEGTGSVRVAGDVAKPGRAMHVGDVLETSSSTIAMFERRRPTASGVESVEAPGGVSFAIEENSAVRFVNANATKELVLSLLRGAVEAQVTPVSTKDAFAIEIGKSRVAVHGTHFRVARLDDGRVMLDLSEGVVSIASAAFAQIVSAPAHAEFDADNLAETLRVMTEASALRAPVELAPTKPLAQRHTQAPSHPVPQQGKQPPVMEPVAEPRVEANEPVVPVPPEQAITNAVRTCLRASETGSEEGTLLRLRVSSKLELRTDENGHVKFARFNPPLNPNVQRCASEAIYRTVFDGAKSITIPLEIER